jgi:hypothetical protein
MAGSHRGVLKQSHRVPAVLDKILMGPGKRLVSVAAKGLELCSCDGEKCHRGCSSGPYIELTVPVHAENHPESIP